MQEHVYKRHIHAMLYVIKILPRTTIWFHHGKPHPDYSPAEQLHHPFHCQTLDVVSFVGVAHQKAIWCSHDRNIFVCSDVLNSLLFPSQSIFIWVIYIVLCFVRLLEQWGRKIAIGGELECLWSWKRIEDIRWFDRSISHSGRWIKRCQLLILLGFFLFLMGFNS